MAGRLTAECAEAPTDDVDAVEAEGTAGNTQSKSRMGEEPSPTCSAEGSTSGGRRLTRSYNG